MPVKTAPPSPAACLGPAAIVRMAYEGRDVRPLLADLIPRAQLGLADPAALFDLATLLQSHGGELAAEGLLMLTAAARQNCDFRVTHGTGRGLRVLAFVTPGDFMANTPIDFLLQGSDAVLILHFVDAGTTTLANLPAHDVAFMAVAESAANATVLARMARLLADWPGPIFNNAAGFIAAMTRDRVSALLAVEPALLAPPTFRVSRADLLAIAAGSGLWSGVGADLTPPLLLRPVGSHAGQSLARIADLTDLRNWLRQTPDAEAYATPFIDYRRLDGLFAKARVVMIKGRPFAGHLALSDHWMVHYLNAAMAENPKRRAEEAAWMRGFDRHPGPDRRAGFAWRNRQALAALQRIIGLDYFAVDCAEMPDGRLLIFEVDVAMIVHDMDSAAVFPYKKAAMRRLFGAFLAALTRASRESGAATGA